MAMNNDHVAIVTGATGRLGREIAVWLGRAGYRCVVHYHSNQTTALEVVAAIEQAGSKAIAVGADFCRPGNIESLIEQAASFGTLKVLVNSASVFERTPLSNLNPQSIQATLTANLTGPLLLSKHFVEQVKKQNADYSTISKPIASIINITDIAAARPWAEYSAYCASKAWLVSVTQSLAKELAPQVTVNAISPGIVIWPGGMDASQEQKQLEMIPQKRFGCPADICKTVDFLLNSDYITGQVINIDGGRSV